MRAPSSLSSAAARPVIATTTDPSARKIARRLSLENEFDRVCAAILFQFGAEVFHALHGLFLFQQFREVSYDFSWARPAPVPVRNKPVSRVLIRNAFELASRRWREI